MPLKQGYGKKTVSQNIKTEMDVQCGMCLRCASE